MRKSVLTFNYSFFSLCLTSVLILSACRSTDRGNASKEVSNMVSESGAESFKRVKRVSINFQLLDGTPLRRIENFPIMPHDNLASFKQELDKEFQSDESIRRDIDFSTLPMPIQKFLRKKNVDRLPLIVYELFEIGNRTNITLISQIKNDAVLLAFLGTGFRTHLVDANLSGVDLSGVDLSGVDLTRANLTGANLTRANLTRANLTNANLTNANLTNANLTEATLTLANLKRTTLTGAKLRGADLKRAKFDDAKLINADLSLADLSLAKLYWTDFTDAKLRGANLARASVGASDFTKTDLQGASFVYTRLKPCMFQEAQLQGVNLTGLDLYWTDFEGANLSNAVLVNTNLKRANLRNAILVEADLTGANLTEADITGADLTRAVISEEQLQQAFKESTEQNSEQETDDEELERIIKLSTPKTKGAALIILGLPYNTPKTNIKKAYLRLVHKYHPDKNKSTKALKATQLINAAYELLTGKQPDYTQE